MSEIAKTPDVILIERQEELAKAQAARSLAINHRADELKANVGKWYKPKNPQSHNLKQICRVMAYAGVKQTARGDAHVYEVESWLPNHIWSPIASEFLNDFMETDAPKNPSDILPI
jgi:hypothetical protein